jgi:hypothetical protein
MRTTDVFPSRFIKAGDIGDHEVVVTVSKVEIEDVGDDRKAVAYFVGKEKGLALKPTGTASLSPPVPTRPMSGPACASCSTPSPSPSTARPRRQSA